VIIGLNEQMITNLSMQKGVEISSLRDGYNARLNC
jgi:hypothetical protein